MAERKPRDVGRKGGAAEAHAGHYFYEPTVTAVTDMVVPATRVQWGPIVAGLVLAFSIPLLFAGLGVGIGLGYPAILYWVVGFAAVGLFLGSMLAARTAKAGLLPAIVHAVIIWGLFLVLNMTFFSGLGASLMSAARGAAGGVSAAGTSMPSVTTLGWGFFIGFAILLVASVLGGIVGMNPMVYDEVPEPAPRTRSR